MRCIVYRGRQGLVLVPDCMRASMEAEHELGPLVSCGEVETEQLAPLLFHEIGDEGYRQIYEKTGAACNTAEGEVASPAGVSPAGCELPVVDKFTDPDYIEFNISTPEAIAKAELRIKQVSHPVPDDGGGPGFARIGD